MDTPRIVYLNHAGTSWPKPDSVLAAMGSVFSVGPARWPEMFAAAHRTIADFFHVDSSRLLLTPSCTAAIGVAVADHAWKSGDRVLTSGYEHYALQRPLTKLSEQGVHVRALNRSADELIDLSALEAELKSGDVKLLAMTAACNVTGQLLPIAEAIKLAHEYGALVLIDGAQIAGWWDLDLGSLMADLFTFAGHKGLQAPWGIGGLYVSPHVSMNSPLATCERAEDPAAGQCAAIPGYCDVGSVNVAALVGMAAAVNWLTESAGRDRLQAARRLAHEFAESVRDCPGIVLYGDVPFQKKVPTVAISFKGQLSSEIAARLRERGLVVSGGFQCAPQAHGSLGTERDGVVRFSFGPRNQVADVAEASRIVRTAIKK